MPEPGEKLEKVASAATRANDAAQAAGGPDEAAVGETAARARDEVLPREIGGRDGPEPTRYGDWEYKGRCIDF